MSRATTLTRSSIVGFVILGSLSIASPALADGPADLIPQDALVALGWSGADAAEPGFLETGIGAVIGDPRIQEMSESLMRALEMRLRQETSDPSERAKLGAVEGVLAELWAHPAALSLTGVSLREGEPVPEIALCVRAGDGAERIFRTIETIRENEGVLAETYPGAALARRVALPDTPVPLIYGIERGCFFLALTENATRALLATIRGESPSIANHPRFRETWRRTVADSAAVKFAYADGEALHDLVLRVLRDSDAALPAPAKKLIGEDGLGRLGPVLLAVGTEGAGFRRSLFVGWRSDEDPGAPIDLEDLVLVPRDTSFFSYEDQDVAGLITGLRDFVASTDPEVSRQLRSFQALADGFLGFRVEEDFLASLGRRFLLFEEPTASGLIPGLCLVLTPKDPGQIQDCVKRLTTSVGAVAGATGGVRVRVEEERGVSFIETAGAPIPIAPAWATRGDRLFITLHPTVLEEVLHRVDAPDARRRSILANEDFLAATRRIGSQQHGIFYTDTAGVIRDLYPLTLPLLQAGIAALGGEVDGLSAAQIPPPYVVNERMFGDIHGCRRTGDGWLWEAHGPLPFTLPDVGSTVMVGMLLGVLPAVGIARDAAEGRAADIAAHPTPARVVDITRHSGGGLTDRIAEAAEIGRACRAYAKRSNGKFPGSLEALAEAGEFDADLLEQDGKKVYRYGGALATSGDSDRVLFHTVEPVVVDQYILMTVTGTFEVVEKDELDRRVRASDWPPRRARL